MEIKNCPFCGGKAELHHGAFVEKTTSYVMCVKCRAKTDSIIAKPSLCSDDEAIKIWNERADEKTRDPENYKKVSYDGIYFCVDGKTPTEMLAERDPDENYIGTKLEHLDAYERQLKRWGIIVNGVDAKVTIQKFKQNEETEKLFPEFIRRSLNCSVRELCEFFMRVTG
jgi:Lar family restriction alleviation protein